MKKVVSTAGLSRAEWLRYRKQGIGGSDAGAVCGLNPYRTAIEVYQDKTGQEVPETDNEAMRQGRELEDYVAGRFTEAAGRKARRANAMYYDEEHPFMLADVDRMIVGENAGLECKTASPYLADQWEDGKIPLHYQLQCHHYMSVMHTEAWYIAVLIYGREFKFYRIERDEGIIRDLIRVEQDFWENHVQKGILPAPDGSMAADRVIAEYFKDSVPAAIPLTGFDEKLKRRQELMEVISRMDTEKKQIEQELKLYMGEAETAENDRYRVSWKAFSSRRLDVERLKAEKPEIYEEFTKQATARRFTVQAA